MRKADRNRAILFLALRSPQNFKEPRESQANKATMPVTPNNLLGPPVQPSASNETNMFSCGSTATIVSLPQNFCFPTSSSITVSTPAQTPNLASSCPPQQLNTMPLGSVFSVNPSQLIQPIPLSGSQQQTFAVALNQQQQQQLTAPSSLTIGQAGPQTITVVSQPHQLVSSTIAGQGLNFVSPTLFTMPGNAGQGQILASPFTQFPIVLGNHQAGLFNSVNPSHSVPSQNIDSAPASQTTNACSMLVPQVMLPGGGNLLATSSNSVDAKPVVTINNPGNVTKITPVTVGSENEPASLSSQPVSVFSVPSPAMATVTKASEVKSRQSSPDTTSPSQNSEHSSTGSEHNVIENSPSQSDAHRDKVFKPIPSPSTLTLSHKMKCERDTESTMEVDTALSYFPGIHCSRMKYTPVDIALPKPSKTATAKDNQEETSKITTTRPDDQDKKKEFQSHLSVESKTDLMGLKCGESSNVPSSTMVAADDSSSDQKGTGRNSFEKPDDPQGDLADVEDLEEMEFVWEDYLKETGATSVPPTAFKHVEMSQQSGLSKGMKLEAPNKNNSNTYWVATIVMTCGPLLRLRYEGYDDNSSADFWSDTMTSDIHPLGWAEENGKVLQPPEVIEEKYPEWKAFLTKRLLNATKAPSYLLDKSTGATPVDQIKEGMRLEIQDAVRRNRLWLVRIVENVGGRLYLRYEGLDSPSHDFWLFYLHERLHPIGWGESHGYTYHPPQAVKSSTNLSNEEIVKSLQSTLKELAHQKLPADIFHDQSEMQQHSFQCGMKLEAVDPRDHHSLGPATVVEVIDKFYFIAEMDSVLEPATSSSGDGGGNVRDERQFGCHRSTPTILPTGWAASKGIKLRPPHGWEKTDFVWDDYLNSCKASPAPKDLFDLKVTEHEFEPGMKLEAVNPAKPSQIGAATITQLVSHLVWVHLDGSPHLLDSHVASVFSLDLFPIGWCVSNGYQLQPPAQLRPRPATSASCDDVAAGRSSDQPKRRMVAVVQPEMANNTKSASYGPSSGGRDLFGGPQIYINHRCFSGPYLSKGRIAELPRNVGPGPVTLVMKEVLGMLINTAYKSSRVLRELQLEGKPSPNMVQQMLKAKYKGKSYRAVVEICRNANQQEDFCRHVCLKLQCCPNLISPHYIAGECPEHCDQLTKTKYTYYYGKRKRKIGRPPGGHSNLEDGQQKPGGKRRKRKRIGLLAKRSSRPNMEDQEDNGEDKESVCSDSKTVDSTSTTGSKDQPDKKPFSPRSLAEKRGKLARERLALKRRYTHHIPPPSEIRTRGAKLPKYSFEKRTHKKIMIVEGSQQQPLKPKKEPGRMSGTLMGSASYSGSNTMSLRPEPPLKLESNPLSWTVAQVTEFLAASDCGDRDLVTRLKAEEIDGQALLLLTLPNVQEYLGIKLGPAIKLCHLIERIKVSFFHQFAAA